jgi:hypothetical protein
MRTALSRGQRAAAASFAMFIVTILSLMFVYYGQARLGLGFEIFSAILCTVWVHRGKD